MDPTDDCPQCGSTPHYRSLVTYTPALTELQSVSAWATSLPQLAVPVCTNCGYLLSVYEQRDDALERTTDPADDQHPFRVDRDLE